MDLTTIQMMLLALGAFITGLSKTGIAGVSVLTVALFANALPAKASTGALLPLLLCADLFGVAIYRKHAVWSHVWRLFPWVAVGIVAGCFALDKVSSVQVQRMIGGILVAMVALHICRQRQNDALAERLPHTVWFAAAIGVLAGFTTMVANAAGPVMILYLLAVGLPKLEFIGTGAWFFLLVNAFKVPFSAHLGLITSESLLMDALLILPMLPGALLGPVIVRHMNQKVFERVALVLAVVAALKLILF
jgi:uncharacterized membrane protein YfcA